MIETLSFPFELLGSSAQGTGQTGGIAVVHPPSSGNTSENPFAKILRDQSMASALINGRPLTIQSADQRQLPPHLPFLENLDLSLPALSDQDLRVEGLNGSDGDDGALPISIVAQPHSLLGSILESDGRTFQKEEGILPTSSTLLTVSRVNETSILGAAEIPWEQMVLSSQVPLAGKSEADAGRASPMGNQVGLPFFTESSARPELSVGRIPAEADASHIPADGDRPSLVQDVVKEMSQLVRASVGKAFGDSVTEPGKNGTNPVTQVASLTQDANLLVSRIPSPSTGVPQGSHRPVVNQTFQAPLPIEETPAGIAGVVQSNQHRLNNTNGVSSLMSDVSGQGKEASMTFPSDLPGESSLSVTGDRSKELVDGIGKSLGIDPNGSQGLNNGMSGSPHSQTGFPQHTASHSSGAGVRATEERNPDFPSPALQRLQMDVQLSDTNRIQIDVGVQHRQVYAGLLMDQTTLKNLAIQFVPQLEDQLAQHDMDLQEFSAEVRDQHREQESNTNSQGSEAMPGQRGFTNVHSSPELLLKTIKRVEEHGLHLVA